MRQVRATLLLSLLPFVGCGSETPRADVGSSRQQSSSEREQSAGDRSEVPQTNPQSATDATAATREELDHYLTRFGSTSTWHYGERAEGELAGTWISVDGDGDRIVFEANGSFSEDFNGNMTAGLYAINDDGRIVAFSKWNGIGIGSHFRLDDQTITGPKGPNPSAHWKRKETTPPAK